MKFGFLSDRFPVETSDGRHVTLLGDIDFRAPNTALFRLPKGAESDGASTPRLLWIDLPPFGAYWRAAVLHDLAYRDLLLWLNPHTTLWQKASLTKSQCDALFLAAMMLDRVTAINRDRLYQGVHLAGWRSFKEDRAPTLVPSVP
jgi:hypothetical protein